MASKGKCVGGMILPYLPCFTWNFFLLYGSKTFLSKFSIFNLTVYAKHWRKLALTTFLGSFLILIVQQFCVALTNSCLLEHATVFPIKNKFPHWTGYFEFLFWISSAILLSKMKSLFLNFSASPQWVTWLLQLLITARSVY